MFLLQESGWENRQTLYQPQLKPVSQDTGIDCQFFVYFLYTLFNTASFVDPQIPLCCQDCCNVCI